MKKIAEKIIVAVFTVTAGNVFSQGIVNSAQRDVVFTNHMEPMKDGLKLFAFNGITTIRDMLGHPRHLELRTKIKSGEILRHRFYASCPSANGNSVKTVYDGINTRLAPKSME
jgi:hypothetical protein